MQSPIIASKMTVRLVCGALAVIALPRQHVEAAERAWLWRDGKPLAHIVEPGRKRPLPDGTLKRFAKTSYGVELPHGVDCSEAHGLQIVPSDAAVAASVLPPDSTARLADSELGEEGFQLISHEHAGKRYLFVRGNTPRAIKHGYLELALFRIHATTEGGWVDWPLNVVMKPEIGYRGTYMLPCWSAQDSFESWERVLRFNSELTLNRNWFWLDGFPVAGHTGQYAGTALADPKNVQKLLSLAHDQEHMKILIGGGWFNWHHEKAVGKDVDKGIAYYLQYIDAFQDFDGFYIEPTGEGSETGNWQVEAEALRKLIRTVLEKKPDFEFALAIGMFNNPNYLKMMAELDPQRVYWWWCWGDPLRDKVLDLYPSVLRWHVITRMSNFHGSLLPPLPEEAVLAGVVTSYDPGQGYGNPWDGWGKIGYDKPRNFDPYNIPYFAHEYFFRERSWNLKLTDADFVKRLQLRLFDADAPEGAADHYWWLSRLVRATSMNQRATPDQLARVEKFLEECRGRPWTPRMADTLARMQKADSELRKLLENEEQ